MIALFPLAMHGGPLWEPLCYAQIGGRRLSHVVTLVLVRDLPFRDRWEGETETTPERRARPTGRRPP